MNVFLWQQWMVLLLMLKMSKTVKQPTTILWRKLFSKWVSCSHICWKESLSCTPQQNISSYFPTVLWVGVYWGSREGRDTRKYTQRGAKKVVYGINQNIFVIVVLSIRSTVPSIVSSRKQKEKKTSKRDFFLKQEILVKEHYQNIFTMLIG